MTNTPKPEALVEQAREWASVVREADKQWSEPLAGLLQEAATTITTLAAERDALREALGRIANPIAAFQRDAVDAGAELDGAAAIYLANNADYLKGHARTTLERTAQP